MFESVTDSYRSRRKYRPWWGPRYHFDSQAFLYLLFLALVVALEKWALLRGLANPFRLAVHTAYRTSTAHFFLSLIFGLINLGLGGLLLRLYERAFGRPFPRLLALVGFLAALWIAGDEARTICHLLGIRHTGMIVF